MTVGDRKDGAVALAFEQATCQQRAFCEYFNDTITTKKNSIP